MLDKFLQLWSRIMARLYKDDPKVVSLINTLARLYSGTRTIKGLSDLLVSGANLETASSLHVNRLNSFLDGVPVRAINQKTFNIVEQRVSEIKIEDHEDPSLIEKVKGKYNHLFSVGNNVEDARLETSKSLNVPLGAVIAFTSEIAPVVIDINRQAPDWSWQEEAEQKCYAALVNEVGKNHGLIVPTGGGKTHIAARLACQLVKNGKFKSIVWVAHRKFLLKQARKAVKKAAKLIGKSNLAQQKLFRAFEFIMIGKVDQDFQRIEDEKDFLILDEAHHGAASSYRRLISSEKFSGLFLTATPNRMDGRSIGLDSICYQTTPKKLFEAGCIIEPELKIFESKNFESAFENERALSEFAKFVLDNSKDQFNKSLICVQRVQEVEDLHQALIEQLSVYNGHNLMEDDIKYATGGSGTVDEDFYDAFDAQAVGILIATSSLVSEGLDIPSLDSVYISYQSQSISHLLQTAGRALRYDEGKQSATIIQVKTNDLKYYFNSDWLYEDITDRLRPKITLSDYSDQMDLKSKITSYLDEHNVPEYDRDHILHELKRVKMGEGLRLFFSGIRYFGKRQDFAQSARWHASLVREDDLDFVQKFNQLCYSEIVSDKVAYGRNLSVSVPTITPLVATDFVEAVNRAKNEIIQNEWELTHRGTTSDRSTTWLHNVSFTYDDRNIQFQEFLKDCVNAEDIKGAQTSSNAPYVIKLSNPISLYFAILISEDQFLWLQGYLSELLERLRKNGCLPWVEINSHNCELSECPFPTWSLQRLYELLQDSAVERQILKLQ
jgi:superfamily II DNA or RNA helicase